MKGSLFYFHARTDIHRGQDGEEGEEGGDGRISASMQNNLRHRVKEIISNDPVTAARLLQGWLEEEK